MTNWITRALDLYRSHTPFVIATLWSIDGASPDHTGARLLVADQKTYGSFNSSHRMSKVTEHSRALLLGRSSTTVADYRLGDVAGVANGDYRVVYTPCRGIRPPIWLTRAHQYINGDESAVVGQTIKQHDKQTDSLFSLYSTPPSSNSSDLLISTAQQMQKAGRTITPVQLVSIACTQTMLQLLTQTTTAVAVIGESAVTRHLVEQLLLLPMEIIWLTRHPQILNHDRLTRLALHEHTVTTLKPHTFVVIATGDHDQDFAYCKLALNNENLPYIGCLGSSKKAEIIKTRLLQEGIAARQIKKLNLPVGLQSINSKQPEIVAASIVAQILSTRY